MSKSEVTMSAVGKLVEETSDEEFRQLLASLPKQKGFSVNLYQLHGFWYPPQHLRSILNCQSHFSARDSDILLVTSPKCGTTWLKALLFTLVNRPVNALTLSQLTTRSPHDLVPFLDIKLYYGPKPDLSALPSPRLFASHAPVSALPSSVWASGCKVVYLCRDPRDAFVSMWHFGNSLRDPGEGDVPLQEAFEAFCKGVVGFGPFWDHILGYWSISNSNVLFLKYEEVKKDTSSCLRQIAEFLGCPFSEDEVEQGVVSRIIQLCSFDHLSNLEVNRSGKQTHSGVENKSFFRRGQVGDSITYLTPEMRLRLDNLVKEKLNAVGFNHY